MASWEFYGDEWDADTAAAVNALVLDSPDSSNTKEVDTATLERRRKQRDIKRRSRARRKDYVESMQEQVRVLEAQYTRLLKSSQLQSPSSTDESLSHATQLMHDYTQARNEVEELRVQIIEMKKKMESYDRFHSSLKGYLSEFNTPLSSEDTAMRQQSSFEPLTADQCHEIIRESYLEIFHPQYRGKRVSSNARVLGWSEERYVDGTLLQFSLTKCFPYVSPKTMMEKSWDIVTTEQHMRTVQSTTIGLKVLQVINKDILITERMVHHPQLNTVTCVHMIVFRFRTDNGYTVAYRAINHSSNANESRSPVSSPLPEFDRDDNDMKSDDSSDASSNSTGKKKKLTWVNTLQWLIFEEEPINNVKVEEVEGGNNGFFVTNPWDAGTQCKVTYGGTIDNQTLAYTSFFLIEVVSLVVRWEQAVSSARLKYSW